MGDGTLDSSLSYSSRSRTQWRNLRCRAQLKLLSTIRCQQNVRIWAGFRRWEFLARLASLPVSPPLSSRTLQIRSSRKSTKQELEETVEWSVDCGTSRWKPDS